MASVAAVKTDVSAARLTQQLTEHAQATEWGKLPSDVREIARQCVLDWTGVALAGSGDHLTSILLEEALAEGGKPLATVVGRDARVAPSQAALINGASSHVLDYDDVNLNLGGHPTAAILPALLALAEVERADGRQLITSFVAGYEMACRVGLLVAPGHYTRGYHATATVGTLGAAAACAHLLKLDPERAAHAIGIAATQAAGLKALFGTEGKPFHAGLAAHNGLRAARLAARGMVARPDALECRQGFALTMSPDFNAAAALGEPGRFFLLENLFKYHASCYGTHAAIECVREIRESHANVLTADKIARVTVRVDKGSDTVCNIPAPRTALEAKFSLRFMTAAALAGADTSDLAFFNDARTGDATLCALRDKVVVELAEDSPHMGAEVAIDLNDGRKMRVVHDAGIPQKDYAKQGRRLAAKFERLVEPALGSERCRALLKLIEALERTPVTELTAACAARKE